MLSTFGPKLRGSICGWYRLPGANAGNGHRELAPAVAAGPSHAAVPAKATTMISGANDLSLGGTGQSDLLHGSKRGSMTRR
jgi:hypothetical protein